MNWRDVHEQILTLINGAHVNSMGQQRINCPACPSKVGRIDTKRCMSVKLPVFYCFRCGTKGKLHVNGYEYADRQAIEEKPFEDTEASHPPQGFTLLTEAKSPLFDPAKRYMAGRGLHEDIWETARIGACVHGRFSGRIIVPIFSPDDVWLGFSGRAWIEKAEMPYRYPRGMHRGEILYNHKALLDTWSSPVVIVEGVFDALALWPHAVAVLGKHSHEQVEALVASKRPIAVCLDPDAEKDAKSLVRELRKAGQTAGMIDLPPGKDPDEVDRDWLLAEAVACLKPGRNQNVQRS